MVIDHQIPLSPQDPLEHPENILEKSCKKSWEHLENIKRISIEYLEKIQKDLWSSENIFEHLITSQFILNTSENFYRVSVMASWEKMSAQGVVINKTSNPAENFRKQLRTSENI